MSVPKDLRITTPNQITLKDGTIATIYPINELSQCPQKLFNLIHKVYNDEVLSGQTLAQIEPLTEAEFRDYYFPHFVSIMILGPIEENRLKDFELEKEEFEDIFMGCNSIKPNYPGRSAHCCNGSFLVSNKFRGKGIGKSLGENYVLTAPKLGFKYSVFNLVYETNVASSRIWDSLGFERIGRIKKAGNLKGLGYVDAIMFGYEF